MSVGPTGEAPRSTSAPGPWGQRLRRLGIGYLVLLALSHAVWWARDGTPSLPEGFARQELRRATAEGLLDETEAVAYRDLQAATSDAPTLVLLHGSPGDASNWSRLLPELVGPSGRGPLRVVAPDLPGFGASRGPMRDLSIRSHARSVLELLDALGVERAHLVGFSLGGGVALELVDLAPERVASLYLMGSIGVQELELLGSYELNHGVHAMQLLAARAARALLPHFGAGDGLRTAVAWGHNFFDTDQRPLRGILAGLQLPVRVVHGEHDPLVPVEAAREHARLVPQAELLVLEGQSHFLPWTWTAELAADQLDWVRRVEAGEAATRERATPERVAAASAPWDPADAPRFQGLTLLVVGLLLALSTLVSEDLACIGAGILVAQERVAFLPATLACFLGIFLGDVGLYVAGRVLGRPALRRAPLRWVVSEDAVERAARWFEQRGARVIFLSRFMPGLRLPTYVSAGMVGAGFWTFTGWFVVAGLLWTPLLVGFASWAGLSLDAAAQSFGRYALWGFGGLVLGILLVERLLVPALTWRGRRLLVGRWRRLTHWEFWPPWIAYAPLFVWFFVLRLRHGGLTLTAANPGIPHGGFLGESKAQTLAALGEGPEIPAWTQLPATLSPAERRAAARTFRASHGLDLPLVLKPDAGQRGSGVQVLEDEAALDEALDTMTVDQVLMEFVPGEEFGVFWVHPPDEPEGRIVSVTIKRLPTVTGDGRRTLEQLILADPRAVACFGSYAHGLGARLLDVVPEGEVRKLVNLGTHARGAVFLDGRRHVTPELTRAVARIAGRFEGFRFGRFDLRAPDTAHLERGEGLRVLELNGNTSEETHIYDPAISTLEAYRTLFRQWSRAYAVGSACARRGARVSTVGELLREVWRYHRLKREHR